MLQVNLYEAKTRLSQLVQAAIDGEEVMIARAGKPAVRLVPVTQATHKTIKFGCLKKLSPQDIDAAFTADVDAEVAALFLGDKAP